MCILAMKIGLPKSLFNGVDGITNDATRWTVVHSLRTIFQEKAIGAIIYVKAPEENKYNVLPEQMTPTSSL